MFYIKIYIYIYKRLTSKKWLYKELFFPLEKEFNKYVYDLQEEQGKKFTESEMKKLAKTFFIDNSERYFYMDQNNDPNRFEFAIETVGVIEPHRILISSMKSLSDKLKNVIMEIEKELSGKPSTIKIKESECVMKSFDVR